MQKYDNILYVLSIYGFIINCFFSLHVLPMNKLLEQSHTLSLTHTPLLVQSGSHFGI